MEKQLCHYVKSDSFTANRKKWVAMGPETAVDVFIITVGHADDIAVRLEIGVVLLHRSSCIL